MRKVAAATAVVMAMAGVTSFGAAAAFADNKPGGATVTGGSDTGTDLDLIQDNSAQEGRLNSLCGQLNNGSLSPEGVRTRGRCLNHDGSVNVFAHTRSKGAHVESGSGGLSAVDEFNQQNIAQKGRLNNACADQNDFNPDVLEGSRLDSDWRSKDRSFSKRTLFTGGGGQVEGGSAVTTVQQQNIAQDGRLNNACADTSVNFVSPTIEGGRAGSDCRNKDGSFSKKVLVKGGGARIEGGSSSRIIVEQGNIAQEGRLNNACANLEDSDLEVTGSRVDTDCRNTDRSFNKKILVKGGGARIEGGSTTEVDSTVEQQNIAQDGRQNNACTNFNQPAFDVNGGRTIYECGNKDRSFSKLVLVKSRGAHVEGGSSTAGDVNQQNIAQEGRQNNHCANPNNSIITVNGGRSRVGCKTVDHSANLGTAEIGRGAKAEGGSSTAAGVFQQNIAQEGRPNTNCANPNDTDISVNGGRSRVGCKTVDHSANLGTAEIGRGAKAEGGSSTAAGVFQQNVAQEGRQNINCANPNNLSLTATGSTNTAQCSAVDSSRNIGSVHR
ncbi:hypothetical protein [Streptomyces sp. NPDC051776]|uniref:hypothetical protein n=1 Tax=Streptomyces sp. NPDC051776 TaxID=3155414 RepID=UPI0034405CDD